MRRRARLLLPPRPVGNEGCQPPATTANAANIRHSGPGFQVKIFQTFQGVPCLIGSGWALRWGCEAGERGVRI